MNYALIVAAGKGNRLKKDIELQSDISGLSTENNSLNSNDNLLPKQFFLLEGKPLWWHAAKAFDNSPLIQGIVLVFSLDYIDLAKEQAKEFKLDFTLPLEFAIGGDKRQESVQNGLNALPKECEIVAIHDAARPFISTAFITKSIEFLSENSQYSGVLPALDVSDTIKIVENNVILSTPIRENLRAVQTPQCFYVGKLLEAHNKIIQENKDITDDASAIEFLGEKVYCLSGEVTNKKITYIEDLKLLEQGRLQEQEGNCMTKKVESISAFGYDVHAYTDESSAKARPFKLGTVPIPTKICIKAHSDGDVLLHALMDALLSLIGGGDIGKHFPDNDPNFDNVSSAILLDKVLTLLMKNDKLITLTHVDITIIAQEPRISPYTAQIHKTLANLLSLPMDKVNIKATTEEKLGFTGELKGIKAVALVSAERQSK